MPGSRNSELFKIVAGILATVAAGVIVLGIEYGFFQRSKAPERPDDPSVESSPGPQAESPRPTPSPSPLPPSPPPSPAPRPVDLAERARSLAAAKDAPVLSTAELVRGTIAVDAEREFVFAGQANTPLLFTLEQTSTHFWAGVQVRDSTGLTRLEEDFVNKKKEFAFTPPRDDAYSLTVRGSRNFGDFLIALSVLGGERAAGAGTTALPPGQGVTGVIAEKAVREYTFAGQANTPLLLTLEQTSKHFWADVEIRDAQGRSLLRDGFVRPQEEIAFTPPSDGSYSLMLEGTRNYGSFLVVLSDPAGAARR